MRRVIVMTSVILNIIKAALISARDIPVLGLLVVADSQNLILCKAHFKNVMEHVKRNRQRMELKHQISQIID